MCHDGWVSQVYAFVRVAEESGGVVGSMNGWMGGRKGGRVKVLAGGWSHGCRDEGGKE